MLKKSPKWCKIDAEDLILMKWGCAMPMLDFDFVYLSDDETEFRNAHIALDIVQGEEAGYSYEISIASDDEISQTELAKILEELEHNRFKKMNINMTKDCKVTVTSTTSTKGRPQ
jgi:hypothetical protein